MAMSSLLATLQLDLAHGLKQAAQSGHITAAGNHHRGNAIIPYSYTHAVFQVVIILFHYLNKFYWLSHLEMFQTSC